MKQTNMIAATLKIRGGATLIRMANEPVKARSSNGERSGTLGVSQDQTLIIVEDERRENADTK